MAGPFFAELSPGWPPKGAVRGLGEIVEGSAQVMLCKVLTFIRGDRLLNRQGDLWSPREPRIQPVVKNDPSSEAVPS